jgi:hypothetical protein
MRLREKSREWDNSYVVSLNQNKKGKII